MHVYIVLFVRSRFGPFLRCDRTRACFVGPEIFHSAGFLGITRQVWICYKVYEPRAQREPEGGGVD